VTSVAPDLAGSASTTARPRFWEVDLARTVAIALMVIYHTGYDIHFLAPTVDLNPFDGGWRAVQVVCGSLFLFVVGVSFMISDGGSRHRGLTWARRYRRHARRSLTVLAAAIAITLATFVALGDDDYVRFGILHIIGVSALLAPLFAGLGWWNVPLAVVVVAVGLAIKGSVSDIPGALILGWEPPAGAGVDHYPLLPWFGLVLLGLAAGHVLYPNGRRAPWLERLLPSPVPRVIGAPGRHSLAIYLIHQPILIALTAGALALFGVSWRWP
jgi:uncharacterized membrane protein